eukprot:282693_1
MPDSNDWEDAEEVDSYNNIQLYTDNQHKNVSKDKKKSNEWICDQCNYSNDRHLAITQNDYKCSNCGVELIITQENKTYNVEVTINTDYTENDEVIAKALQMV